MTMLTRPYFLRSCTDGTCFEWVVDTYPIKNNTLRPERQLTHREIMQTACEEHSRTRTTRTTITDHYGQGMNWLGLDSWLSAQTGPLVGISVPYAMQNFTYGLEITLGIDEVYGCAAIFRNPEPFIVVVGTLTTPGDPPACYVYGIEGYIYPSAWATWATYMNEIDPRIRARYPGALS
jgi:hypothetical protein